MTVDSWQKLSESHVQVGWRHILKRLFRLPDGREAEYCIKREGKPVCVLALTADHLVVLARQYRPGPELVLTEMPGGGMENDEDPAKAAARELLEETGYAGDLKFVGTSLMCAYSAGLRYNFVATNCRKVAEPKPDQNEFIEVVAVTLDEFRRHLRSGQLTDVTTGYLGLDYLGLL